MVVQVFEWVKARLFRTQLRGTRTRNAWIDSSRSSFQRSSVYTGDRHAATRSWMLAKLLAYRRVPGTELGAPINAIKSGFKLGTDTGQLGAGC
jgi:hypothetical protein